jgi:hypothetical protein
MTLVGAKGVEEAVEPLRTGAEPGSTEPLLVRVTPKSHTTLPVGRTNEAMRQRAPWRMYSCSRYSGLPCSTKSVGCWRWQMFWA